MNDAKEPRVRRPALVVVGVVVAILGVVFTLQGLGLVGGSPMTGSTLWAILGPIVALFGIVVAVYGLRAGRRR